MPGPTYGPDGLQIQTAVEIQSDLATALEAQFGASIQAKNGKSVFGQLVSALSQLLLKHQEGIDGAYQSAKLDGAEGVNLDRDVQLLGLTRNVATATTVVVIFANSSGAPITVPQGAVIQITASGLLFVVVDAVVVPNGGAAAGALRAVIAGPTVVAMGQVWAWITSFAGVAFITTDNAANAGVTGTSEETDGELRIRALASAHLPGKGTLDAIRAGIADLDGVTYVRVFENTSMAMGIASPVAIALLPAKSFVAVVKSSGTSAAIAAVIFAQKPAGIATYGSTTANVADADGFAVPINYEAATAVPLWLTVTITGSGAAYKTAIQTALAAYLNGLSVGGMLTVLALQNAIFDNAGPDITDITLLCLGDVPAPGPAVNGPFPWNYYPTIILDDAHIALTFV